MSLAVRLRSGLFSPLVWLAAAVAGAGATTTAGRTALLAIAVLAVVVALLERFGVGVMLGLLTLGGLDALPGPNLELMHVVRTITAQHVVVGILAVTLLRINWLDGFRGLTQTKAGRALCLWSFAFLLLYAVTVARTALTSPVPLQNAAWICVWMAFLAVILPLLVGPLRDPRVRQPFLVTCAVGAVVAGVAQSVASLGLSSLSLLVHVTQAGTVEGLIRLYTGASVLPVAALPLGLGLVLFGESGRLRATGGAVALSSTVAIVLALTRAEYVAEVLGIGAASILWLVVGDRHARTARRRVLNALLGAAAAAILLITFQPPAVVSNAIGGVSRRVTSTFAALANAQNSSNTLGFRAVEASELEYALGGKWLFGLGFQDPNYDYNALVPSGSIENSDLGYLNTVMTIGVFGTVLYYLPVLLISLLLAIRRLLNRPNQAPAWISFGVFAWAIGVIISSKDLVILFSPTGVVSVAAMLGLALAAVAGDRPVGESLT
jgi:hypothetical protein